MVVGGVYINFFHVLVESEWKEGMETSEGFPPEFA